MVSQSLPSPPTALVIAGRPPARPIAGLAATATVAVVAAGVFVDESALVAVGELAGASGAAEALRVEGALADCTKLNPPTAITDAIPKSAKPWVMRTRCARTLDILIVLGELSKASTVSNHSGFSMDRTLRVHPGFLLSEFRMKPVDKKSLDDGCHGCPGRKTKQ